MDDVTSLQHAFQVNLKRAMREQGINQTEIAKLLGTSNAYISNVLNARYSPTLTTVEKFAAVLKVNAFWLLTPSTDDCETEKIAVSA